MSDRAAILRLARNLARQNARRYSAPPKRASHELDLTDEIEKHDLRAIPPSFWNELDSYLDHNPSFGLALARVLHAIVMRTRTARVRATADLALIRALNACGEFKQALALCPDTARRFEKRGQREHVARVWLEAAWAETWLGNLGDVKEYLNRAAQAYLAFHKEKDLRLQFDLIRARTLHLRGSFQEALSCLDQVLTESTQAKPIDTARVLREIGLVQSRLNPSAALGPLQRARQIFQAADCPTETALCRYFMTQAYIDLNRFDEAHTELASAQQVFRQLGFRFFDALCDLEMGFLYSEHDRLYEAMEYYTRARAIFTQLGAQQEVSSCDINIGWELLRLNRYADAFSRFESAASIALTSGRQTKAALCFLNMGVTLEKQGRYASALAHYQRARAIFAREKMVERLIEVNLNLGQVYFQLGDYAQATSALGKAHASSHKEGMSARLAVCELYRARVWMAQGKKTRARDALRHARALFTQNKQPLLAALCDRELALLESKPDAALTRLRRSRQLFAANGMQIDAALCDLTRAELALKDCAWRNAERFLSKAQAILRYGFPDQNARVLYDLARAAQAQGQPQRALENYAQAAQTLAQLRGGLELETLSNSFFQARQRVIQDGLDCARQQRSPEHALALVEASKAQAFLRLLDAPEWRLDGGDAHLRALQERERELFYRLAQERQQLVAQVRAQDAAALRGQAAADAKQTPLRAFRALAQEYETVAQQLRLARHNLAGVPQLDPFSLDEFRAAAQQQWGKQWLALDYYFDRQWLYIICIDCSRVTLHAQRWTWLDQQMLEQCADLRSDMRELVYGGTLRGQAIPRHENPLAYLGAKLLPVQVCDLPESATLLIAPHGLAHQLPFRALQINGEFLAARATVLNSPNLQSFTQLCRDVPRVLADKTLVCGVSDFGGRARELLHAQREVNGIRRLNPSATVLWQTQATRARLQTLNERGRLRDFSILHFATHAIVDTDAPHSSHILLGTDELGMLDITKLQLEARLVTLSACSSNVGRGGGGDEWVSLARAFFYAGARGIVASLWAVQDESTAYLMEQFYRHLRRGEPIAAALRHAQLTLRAEGFSPFQWAPFIALGNV